jgi:predicted N-acyltransferase
MSHPNPLEAQTSASKPIANIVLAENSAHEAPNAEKKSMQSETGYTTHYTFTASKYDELTWQRLLPKSLEGYRYHLAFELAKVEGFKVGYVSILKGRTVAMIVPVFITNYSLDTTVQGALKNVTSRIQKWLPNLLSIKLLCVGSPITDSAQIGFLRDQPLDPEILNVLNQKLEEVADKEGAKVIAFKDMLETDLKQMMPLIEKHGFTQVDNMPVAKNAIYFKNLDEYLSTLSYSTRKSLRRKMKAFKEVRIEEYDGMPPHMEDIYQLYLNCYEKSELKFEKLTLAFFESLAGLMPKQCRFVLYFVEEELIGFNCLLLGNQIMMDKYIGMDYEHSTRLNLYTLSWLHNIQMCIRDGFKTFQSGQAAYATKLSYGATLENTFVLFKHRNKVMNRILKMASNVLAYANFDEALKNKS